MYYPLSFAGCMKARRFKMKSASEQVVIVDIRIDRSCLNCLSEGMRGTSEYHKGPQFNTWQGPKRKSTKNSTRACTHCCYKNEPTND